MSEHPHLNQEGFVDLVSEVGRNVKVGDIKRIYNHLMYSPAHSGTGFDIFHGGIPSDQGLIDRFEDELRAHKAAVLRGEVLANDLSSLR